VREGLAAGRTVEQLQQDGVLEPWAAYAGSYVSVDRWIATLAEGIQGRERKQEIFEPMYRAFQEGGVVAAIALYRDLKRTAPEEYELGEVDLLVIGDKLLKTNRIDPAIAILELSLEEYPDSPYAYYANFDLAQAHQRAGHREAALRHCEAAHELSPDSPAIAALLEELRSGM
jgi:tetratricopeptide (TPR) repeat protein